MKAYGVRYSLLIYEHRSGQPPRVRYLVQDADVTIKVEPVTYGGRTHSRSRLTAEGGAVTGYDTDDNSQAGAMLDLLGVPAQEDGAKPLRRMITLRKESKEP